MMTAPYKIRDGKNLDPGRGEIRVTALPSSASLGDAFGDLLRRRRVAARMTQEELACRAGVSVRTVRDTESGRVRRPRTATVELLAAALGLGPAARAELVELSSREYWTERAPEPLAVGDGRERQLPPAVATFVGREAEIASIVAALDPVDRCAAVAITGMAGVGKTALAVHVAHLLADRFPDGQL
ncbi:MAG: helix-turn-helix domain-containing protein, partial [Actinomycetes bacterium]